MKRKAPLVVVDNGNALIRSEPRAAFRHAFDSEAQIGAMPDGVGFAEWNCANDRGRWAPGLCGRGLI
ncbi:MAG: hypothetical protein H5U15_11160 [Roseovarius sp.]|jgi:2-haloacid dehalogenase|nr:hypothetical protein [Roseovarius sp.]